MSVAVRRAVPRTPPLPFDPTTLPEIFGVSVNGNCMAPEYPHGVNVKVSKKEPYAKGDVVCIWFRPELIVLGSPAAMIKRIALMPPPWVKGFPYQDNAESDVRALLMLERNDRPDKWLQVRCADVLAIHKMLGVLAPAETEPDLRQQ